MYEVNPSEDEFRKSSAYVCVKSDDTIWANFHWHTVTTFVLVIISLTGTLGLQLVGGLNSFAGVTFLVHWMVNFNIMYMCFSIVGVGSIWLFLLSIRYITRYKRPYQFNQELLGSAVLFTTIAFLTLIPVAVYAFKVGDVRHYCADSVCDAHALVFGNNAFALLWLGFFGTSICISKLHWALSNSTYDLTNIGMPLGAVLSKASKLSKSNPFTTPVVGAIRNVLLGDEDIVNTVR